MNHCSDGPTTDTFDLLTPLVEWVETGAAPDAVVASARPNNGEVPEQLQGVERLLCPVPQVARYQGGRSSRLLK
jgi:feruloyl esterase